MSIFKPALAVCAFLALIISFVPAQVRAEAPPTIEWIRQFGGPIDDLAYSVATDGLGNPYVSGVINQVYSSPTATADGFLRKYDSAGNLTWDRTSGIAGFDSSHSVAVDSSAHPVTVFDSSLRKYDSAGNVVWTRNRGGSVAIDASDNIVSLFATLQRYDSAGNVLWTTTLQTPPFSGPFAVAVDPSGNSYVTGATRGANWPLNSDEDIWVSKYDSNGNFVWYRQVATPFFETGYSVAADAAGNCYVTGVTDGSLGAPHGSLHDPVLIKFDTLGNQLWARQISADGDVTAYSVALDSLGNPYIAGEVPGSIAGPNAGEYDIFVTKYDTLGNHLWDTQFGSEGFETTRSLTVDATGNIFVSGFTYGNLGGENAGSIDAFLVKLAPVPEPATLVLAVAGMLSAIGFRKQARRKK